MQLLIKVLAALGLTAGVLAITAAVRKPDSVYKDKPSEQNPFEGKKVVFVEDEADPVNADGVRGHLVETTAETARNVGVYEKVIKRSFDVFFSFAGMIILSPLLLVIGIAIFIDDPGPVIFTQKRIGKDKRFFKIHKFRSMRISASHDVPTHQLKDPEQYITRIGRVLRKHSLDELPQIWDIWIGNMSIIGPRPALWNQNCLTALRDSVKLDDGRVVNANSVKPGLTGLAQISGRDELELEEKSRLDGEYCSNVSFFNDLRCFLGTIKIVLKHDGVVEGGTGKLHRTGN